MGIFPDIGLKNRPNIYGIGTSVLNRILKFPLIKLPFFPTQLLFYLNSEAKLKKRDQQIASLQEARRGAGFQPPWDFPL